MAELKEEVKNKGGAPSKYRSEYCESVIEFFNREPFEVVMTTDDEGNEIPSLAPNGKPVMIPCKLPTKEGFAISLGVHRETINNWAAENKEFFDAIKRAESMQKEILVQNGMSGLYEKTFAIFVAKNVTDMKDIKAVDHTSTDGSMSPKKDFNDFYSK